ncbi:MAG: hypothetical protein D6796_03435, partial [Caldilineae bacterium]
FTPRPPFLTPYPLLPADGTVIEGEGSTVLLSWTAAGDLPDNTFYVVFLTAEGGETHTYWTQATSYRLPAEARPPRLTAYTWYVVVMEKLGVDEKGIFYGHPLSSPGPARTFRWR